MIKNGGDSLDVTLVEEDGLNCGGQVSGFLPDTGQFQHAVQVQVGKDIFNFEIKELAKSSYIKKKKTPSQIRREAVGREEVKLKHSEKNSEATDKVAQDSTENTVNEIITKDSHKAVADKTAKNISEAPVKETTADNTFKAVETQKPDAPTEKFKCNQCELKTCLKRGWHITIE